MTLRTRTLCLLGITLLALFVVQYLASGLIIQGGFAEQEQADTQRDVERALSALTHELQDLEGTTRDWATWDDTYRYVEDQNDEYFQANLATSTSYVNNRVDVMAFVQAAGPIVFAQGYDRQAQQPLDPPAGLVALLSTDTPLLRHSLAASSLSGLIMLPDGPFLVASAPIVKSDHTGPVRGTLLFGRRLDSAEVKLLSTTTHLALTVQPVELAATLPGFREALPLLSAAQPIAIRPVDEQTIAGYALLNDVTDRPILVLRVDLPREVYARGRATALYSVASLLAAGLVFGVVVLLLVERLVLVRLARLSSEVGHVVASGDLSTRVLADGRDELAALGGVINELLASLEASQAAQERAQQALRESEQRFRDLADATLEGIAIHENDRILVANGSLARLFGYDAAELVGQPLLRLIAVDAQPALRDELDSASGSALEASGLRRDGTRFPIELQTRPFSYRGRLVCVTAIRDISERKRAEAALRSAEQYLHLALASVPIAIYGFDQHGVFTVSEGAGLQAIEHAPGATVGQSIFALYPPDSPIVDSVQRALQGEAVHREIDRGGVTFDARYLPVRDDDGRVVGVIGAAVDISERKALERMKDEFVSITSHELRTPLTSIKGFVDLLLAGEVGELNDEQREFLGIVKDNTDRLVALISDLLDLSRLESGRMELRCAPLGLAGVVRNVASTLRPQIEAKQQVLALELSDGLPAVLADRDRLTQILTNLLSNAHKYTPRQGRITVSARVDGEQVRIDVQDTGVGLTADEQARLFTRFFRARNRATRDASGTGLGLVITRSLVELHGGRLTVFSVPGEGSTFSFTLPVATEPLEAEPLLWERAPEPLQLGR